MSSLMSIVTWERSAAALAADVLGPDAEGDAAAGVGAQVGPRTDLQLVRAEAHERRRPSWASTRFIAGEPMKPATKRFAGRSYSTCGRSTCWSRPLRMTQTRSPSVIASLWSCVT